MPLKCAVRRVSPSCYVMLFYEASISYLLSEDSNCIYFMKLLELNGVSDKVVSSVNKYYL